MSSATGIRARATAIAAGMLTLAAATAQVGDPSLILPPSADAEAAAGDATAAGAASAEAATIPEEANRDAPASTTTDAAADAPAGADASALATNANMPIEEVVVINESEWRLPDLGSAWRRDQENQPNTDRMTVSYLPLYDPENDDPVPDIFERNSALHRMGMIEVIRIRFGGRPRD